MKMVAQRELQINRVIIAINAINYFSRLTRLILLIASDRGSLRSVCLAAASYHGPAIAHLMFAIRLRPGAGRESPFHPTGHESLDIQQIFIKFSEFVFQPTSCPSAKFHLVCINVTVFYLISQQSA